MIRWTRGEAEIERMLKAGEPQRVTGTAADGAPWLAKATTTIRTAEAIASSDPNSCYTLAYDGARFACVGLLAQQGLRPTSTGGHYAVQLAVICQFGASFDPYAVMRRRRNELEYPEFPDETVEPGEAAAAIAAAMGIINAARKLIDSLGLF